MDSVVTADMPAVTESGGAPKVSYLIITYNRAGDLRVCLESVRRQDWPNKEIIVVDNNSEDETQTLFDDEFTDPEIHYFRMRENLGVSGGRNEAIDRATGAITITLDDDALFTDEAATKRIVDKFQADPSLGILALKISNFNLVDGAYVRNPALDKICFPWRDDAYSVDDEFETCWFVGAGHAVRGAAYREAGPYRDYRPYGHEELDLSLRVLGAGYRIVYFPEVEVHHRISKTGRLTSGTFLEAVKLKNRIKISILYLPWYSIGTFIAVRSAYTLYTSKFNIGAVLYGGYMLLKELPSLIRERRPLGSPVISKIRQLKGPLYY